MTEFRAQKIRSRFLEAPLDSETLQDLVKSELKAKKHTATEGLVWLTRCVMEDSCIVHDATC